MPIFFQGSRDTGSLVSMRRRVVLFVRELCDFLLCLTNGTFQFLAVLTFFSTSCCVCCKAFSSFSQFSFSFFNAMAWFSCVNVLESCSFRWVACVNALEMCLFSRERPCALLLGLPQGAFKFPAILAFLF